MKVTHIFFNGLYSLIFLSTITIACVNRDAKDALSKDDFTIRLRANVNDIIYTRIVGNNFEIDDAVGLFALVNGNAIYEDRYANNFRFIRGGDDLFNSEETLFYPIDDSSLNLISYYPYQEVGLADGSSTMPVSVSVTQDIKANYSKSDFLVAEKKNVVAGNDAVVMNYNHQFSRLNIALTVSQEDDLSVLLAANPKLTIHGLFTKADYDFSTGLFSNFSEEEDISISGEWKIADKRLIGAEVILIPQKLTAGNHYIRMVVDGKEYTSLLPPDLHLRSGKQREIELAYKASEDVLLSTIKGEISNWTDDGSDTIDSEPTHKYINVSKLLFEQSDIYKVMNQDVQVAEICKEYLVTPDFASTALVAYPMNLNGTADLSKGIVLQLVGNEGKVHGGSVSWNIDTSDLVYTPGNKAACKNIYILNNGQLALSISDPDDALYVTAVSDIIRDVRGSTIFNYPKVKIGTQYWIKTNLHASSNRKGVELPLLTEMSIGASGYLTSSSVYDNYYYTPDIALSDKFLPIGWELPDWNDWKQLRTYIQNKTSVLKTGTWIPSKVGDVVTPVTNLSGFGAFPVALYVGASQSEYEGKYVSYWTLNESRTALSDSVVLFRSELEEMKRGTVKVDKAYSIRCIRK